MRTTASSVSNKKAANALHNSVLPTPVGPKNKNEPIGRLGSDSPARERRIALQIAVTAWLCPIMRLCNASSIFNNFSFSLSSIFATGICVHLDTTSAISSSVTLLRSNCVSCFSAKDAVANFFSSSGIWPYCNSAMRVKSPARRAVSNSKRARSNSPLIVCAPCKADFSLFQMLSNLSDSLCHFCKSFSNFSNRFLDASSVSFFNASRSIFNCTIFRSKLSNSSGLESISMRMLLAASSMRSIALSGNCLSEM